MIVQSPNGLRIRAEPEFCALLAIAWHRHPSIEYAPKSGYEQLPCNIIGVQMRTQSLVVFGLFKTIVRMMSILPAPLLVCAGQALSYKRGGKTIVPKGSGPRTTGLEQDLLRKHRDATLAQTNTMLQNYLGNSLDEGDQLVYKAGFVGGSVTTVGIAHKSASDGDGQLRVLSSLGYEHEQMRQELIDDLQKLYESEQDE